MEHCYDTEALMPQPIDQRRYRRQTENRMLISVLLMLVLGGGGLIWLVFGRNAALSSMLCLIPGAIVIAVLWLFLGGLERLTRP